MEKDPTSYSLITYTWVFCLAILGGIVNFMRKLQNGQARIFNIAELVGEVVTSGFAGVICFWLCENANISPLVTAALVGIVANFSSSY